MEMQELINLIINNGVAVACVGYFMYFNNTTMKDFTQQLNSLSAMIEKLMERLNV